MVVTISRQVGAGGNAIGHILAEQLGYEYCDKMIIELASEKSGISEELFEKAEKQHNSFLYSLATANYAGYSASVFASEMGNNDNLFVIQSNAIREVAKKGNCVIVGRCANQVLMEDDDVLKVFLHAPREFRVKNVMEENNLLLKDAEAFVKKMDKKRAAYYNFFTSGEWGNSADFDVCIDTSVLGIEGTAEIIKNIVLMKNK